MLPAVTNDGRTGLEKGDVIKVYRVKYQEFDWERLCVSI
jgi:hypothetical protein